MDKRRTSKNRPLLLTFITTIICFIILIPHLQSCKSTEEIDYRLSNNKDDTSGTDKSIPHQKFVLTKNQDECLQAPDGMTCIPGGYSYIGADNNDPEAMPGEKPMQKVYVSTFYIDKHEISNADYNTCVKAGACAQFRNISHPMFRDSIAPQQPAVPLSWESAYNYCKWVGKRLPTENEWEKVARGGLKATMYPWGNDKPDCNKANYRPCFNKTSPVGSFPPGHFGVYDMAGNGYEWVNDWATPCRTGCGKLSCGQECLEKNAMGPCSGRYPCGKRNKKMLKGGSWWWPASHLRGSWRRSQVMWSGGHRLSARCASDSPHLTNAPAWMIKSPPPSLADPVQPTAGQLKILHGIETDVLNKPLCAARWTSPAHCKDPESYVKSNEAMLWYYARYLKNLGGGYMGVAADANYTFIAHARSRWVWLFDFDKNINNLHKILKVLIIKSESPQIFVSRWQPQQVKSTCDILQSFYGTKTGYDQIKNVFLKYRAELFPFYAYSIKPNQQYGDFGWLRSAEAYRYIRLLYTQNRIAIVPGDMLKNKTMRSIAKAVKKLNTKIRIYYPSNAEEFWIFNLNYKKNVLSLPFDEASVVIRTVHEYPWHTGMYGFRFWHYVVHGALNYQKKIALRHYYKIDHFKHERIFPHKTDTFSTIHVPSTLPEGVAPALD